jgi:Fe-Mn family superoxide dismutase
MSFTLPPLPYPADALEAAIDKMTMEIHHDRHHKAYVDNLNAALQGHDALLAKPVNDLLRDIKSVPEAARQKVINNGGGHSNHTLFWEIMGPGGGEPTGTLGDAIKSAFGDFAGFKGKIKEAATGRFGSGWAWLVYGDGKLQVLSTANQDSPYMNGQTPILGVDVWEHAYYLRYQNKRPDYVDAWWKVANWNAIAQRYSHALSGK